MSDRSDYTPVRVLFGVLATIVVGLAEYASGGSVGASLLLALIFAAVLLGTYELVAFVRRGQHLHLSWH